MDNICAGRGFPIQTENGSHQQDGDALLMRRVRQVFGNFCPQRLPCASLSGLFVSERGKISQFFAWASKMGTAFA
jgi:hypothetical protein